MYNRANWSLEEAIQKRVDEESWVEWAEKPVATLKYDYRPTSFKVTSEIKQAFASSFEFIKSIPKL